MSALAPSSTYAVIQTSALGKTHGRTVALHPTTLAVPRGSIFALLGHNGAGKTTLLKMLVNIFAPTEGAATVLGLASTQVAGDVFTRIGYVSENQELPEWMTVRAFLDYQAGFYPRWDHALQRELVARFELPLDRKLKHLSRGQRMKAALASVLTFSPELIVLDEPFSGLDPLVRDELIEAMLDTLARNESTTVVLSSHDLAEIESFATHVAFLSSGRVLFTEDMQSLQNRFREVTVTLDAASGQSSRPQADTVPPTWLNLQQAGHTVRFTHSAADTEDIAEQVQGMFPAAVAIESEPMPLRTIFLAIAKSGRDAGEGTAA